MSYLSRKDKSKQVDEAQPSGVRRSRRLKEKTSEHPVDYTEL